MQFDGQRILVLGLGESGLAAAEFSRRRGAEVTVFDTGSGPELEKKAAALRAQGIAVVLGAAPAWGQDRGPDLAVTSPGIAPESTLGRLAASLPCPVLSELEFGYLQCACPILAITGTNGKTTTTELTTHCLRQAGLRVMASGNIGTAIIRAAAESQALDYMVVEVSSFQLEHCHRFAPVAGACLNVTPDHLDRHGTMDEYFRVKMKMFEHIRRPRNIIVRADLARHPLFQACLGERGAGALVFSSANDPRADFFYDGRSLCHRDAGGAPVPFLPRQRLALLGRHNVENALAAAALCQQGAGIPPAALAEAIASYRAAPHRLEKVAEQGGVLYVNDSKATNLDAAEQAIRAVAEEIPGKILLIAGGLDKGIDFQPLTPLLKEFVKAVFLIGKCRESLAELWGGVVPCSLCDTLEEAVDAAAEQAAAGDCVLLAPGCASMDMFRNYADRGQRFVNHVTRRFGL